MPDSIAPGLAPQRNKFSPSVIEGSLGRRQPESARAPVASNDDDSVAAISIPVMGRIAAGVPIEAIQHKTHSISVPPDMISGGEHYALEVKGDSMIEAGIFDGDTVIIRNANTASPGEIIVALVDDEEATLKRFRRKGASIALEAANPAYETRIFGPDRVKVQGKLVGSDPPLLIGARRLARQFGAAPGSYVSAVVGVPPAAAASVGFFLGWNGCHAACLA